ncbi:Fis family transcriptional regulator [Caballeronia arvi]|uniref:Fis family transcriptional regulator n=1 Tax=Caballeronia arvi TaxID=1777135 RepID=A0A158KYK5_9BURK|nr:Fis family transcriptional regulator [Caballeronia arvi]
MPECAAREISLVNHLSFAACRSGAGSAYLFNELIRLVYLSFYVQDAGFGDTDLMIYASVEAAVERSLERAESGRAWMLDAEDLPLFEAVLRESDRQLAHAPRHVHIGARERLERFATSGRASPLRATKLGRRL